MAENGTSYGLGSNFSGAEFCLAQSIDGLLVSIRDDQCSDKFFDNDSLLAFGNAIFGVLTAYWRK